MLLSCVLAHLVSLRRYGGSLWDRASVEVTKVSRHARLISSLRAHHNHLSHDTEQQVFAILSVVGTTPIPHHTVCFVTVAGLEHANRTSP